MAKIKGLSLRIQWLGNRLKRARLEAGYTLDDAAAFLEITGASISRFEKGTLRVKTPYLRELIGFYGVNRRERSAMLQLNEDAWRKDWWDGNTDDLEVGFMDHTWLEARATRICAFEPLLVHGLLQTPEYTKAVTARGMNVAGNSEQVARSVELRVARQRILTGDEPTKLSVIMEEPALRRPIGGTAVLKQQLRHLLELGGSESVAVRILPNTIDWDPGYAGPFSIFEMPDPFSPVAFTETLAGRTFLEEDSKVARFSETYDCLEQLSLSSEESTVFIMNELKDLA